MSVISFAPQELFTASKSMGSEAQNLATVAGGIVAPNARSYGGLLASAASITYPEATDSAKSLVMAISEGVTSISDRLTICAQAYVSTEEEAVALANSVFSTSRTVSTAPGSGRSIGRGYIPSTDSYSRAEALLGHGAGTRAGEAPNEANPLGVLAGTNNLSWLSADVFLKSLVPRLLGGVSAWIISKIGFFDEAIEELTGDADEIRAQSQMLTAVKQAMDSHADSMNTITRAAVQRWTGPGSLAFQQISGAEQLCSRAAGSSFETMGKSSVALASYVGSARKAVVAIAGRIIGDLIAGAGQALASLITFDWPGFIQWGLRVIASGLRDIGEVLQQVSSTGSHSLGQIHGLGHDMERAASILRTDSDPGGMEGVAEGSHGANVQGTEAQAHDRDLMALTDAAFNDVEGDTEPYEEVSDPAGLAALGLTPEMLAQNPNGFRAKVFKDPNTGETVVVFEGTDFGDVRGDVAEDAAGAAVVSPQTQQVMAISEAINNSPNGDNVVYAGHSLGGRLAAIASMTSGNAAVTFNAAGVSPATVEYIAQTHGMPAETLMNNVNNGQVRLYTTADDPLTNVQESVPGLAPVAPDAVGAQIHLGGDHNWVTQAADGHGVPNVMSEWDKVYGPGGTNPLPRDTN